MVLAGSFSTRPIGRTWAPASVAVAQPAIAHISDSLGRAVESGFDIIASAWSVGLDIDEPYLLAPRRVASIRSDLNV